MHSITRITRRFVLYVTALVLVAGYPLAAMADTQEPTTPPVVETVETTEQASPVVEEPELTYTYNTDTGYWDSEKWWYNPATGKYETPPVPTVIEPIDTSSTDETIDVDTTVNIDNNVTSDATSGDAAVDSNTTAGSATTGDAAAMATLLNIVNSSVTTGDNQKVASFTQDILGDVKGDIILYPMLLKAMLEAEVGGNTSSTIDVTDNFELNNNVDLAATSGHASVTGNTSAGDAMTGSAAAVANVVNILNSMIATQQSFIGTINIYGNLEGDILIAPDFIPQMIASNVDDESSSDIKLSTENSTEIVNNISTMAESGAAAVFGNTSAGDATTGNADTGIVIFNLTGHEIIAKNSLLVFVNVLGKWVGVIVDAPAGATSALIGYGVTTDQEYAPDLTVSSESKHGITNTISVDAQSGDAVVSGNTSAGGATTGSASALANIANISNSQFGITDWFGVLFINVFHNWYGSFGINTFYGDSEELATEVLTGPIQFIPSTEVIKPEKSSINNNTLVYLNTEATPTINGDTAEATTLNATSPEVMATLGKATTNAFDTGFDIRLFIVAGSLLAIGLSLLGLKKLFS